MKELLRHALRTRLFRIMLVTTYGQAIQLGLQLVTVPVMIAHWGLQAYGVWLILFAFPAYFAMADLGLSSAAVNDMVRHAERGEREKAAQVFHATQSFLLGIVAVLGLGLGALVFFGPHNLLEFAQQATHGQARTAAFLLLLYGLVNIIKKLVSAGFVAGDRQAFGGAIFQTAALAETLGGLAVVLAGGGIVDVAATYLAVCVTVVAATYALLRIKVPWLYDVPVQARAAELRRLARPAFASLLLPVANAMTFQGSVIGLGATSGAGAVPLFTTPRTVTRFALQIAMIASNASIQRFAAADARNDGKRKAALLLLGLGASTVILLPAALALLVFGPWVVARWTHGTVEIGLGMMLPLALSMLLAGLWMPLGNLLIALNRHTGYALVFTIVSLACVGAGALASAFAGITAMAWAIAALDLLMAAWIATRFAQGGIVSRAQMIDCLWELAGRMRSM